MEFTFSLLFAYTKQKLNLNLDKYYAYNWNCPCFLFNVIKIYRKWKWHLGFYWEIESGLIWKLEVTSQFVAYFKISNSRKFMGHHSAARLYFHAKIGAKLSEKKFCVTNFWIQFLVATPFCDSEYPNALYSKVTTIFA